MATGRYAMPAVVISTDIFVFGGLGATGLRTKGEGIEGIAQGSNGTEKHFVRADVEVVQTASDPLKTSAEPLRILPRFYHAAEVNGPYIYIMGGVTADGVTPRVERIDSRNGHYKEMAPMPRALRAMASATVGSKIYLVGGGTQSGVRVAHLLIYDIPTNSWKVGAPLPEKKECRLLPWQGNLIAIGGYLGPSAKEENANDTTAAVQRYDIATDTWSALPPLPFATSGHSAAVISEVAGQEQVVLFGDYLQPGRVLSGNPNTGEWEIVQNIDFKPRCQSAAAVVGDKIYVIGGKFSESGSYLDDIQVFGKEYFAKGRE